MAAKFKINRINGQGQVIGEYIGTEAEINQILKYKQNRVKFDAKSLAPLEAPKKAATKKAAPKKEEENNG